MKRSILLLLVVVFGSLLVSAQTATSTSSQNSLADAAAKAKADKKALPAKHVYTNDDIVQPDEQTTATATAGDGKTPAATDAKADSDKAASDKPADKDTKDSKAEAAKNDALKQKIADLKKSIADQQKDLDITEREHQIKVAEYYADAGTQLRTGDKWFEQEKAYQDGLDAKKKTLSDAKAQLDDLNEQARKAGVPTS